MGKVVERRKKKGRPSLIDLQRRTIEEQQQLQQKNSYNNSATHSNPNSATATAVRRSARRNPCPDSLSLEEDFDDQEDHEEVDELAGEHPEKKLKLVLRVTSQKSSLNSDGLDSNVEEDNDESAYKKRKISVIGEGSGLQDLEMGDKSIFGTNPTKRLQGTDLDFGPSTHLPNEKLLLFILDKLQKKDRYRVFSEPVDPEELPDYHEVIEHPMDFATVRKKLANRAYAKLEEFEKDVFLICSNAMQYNAPDTIFFRQARSILELAKKSFRNLRQDSDDIEPEPKVVRRGRPPTKNLKQAPGQSFFERASSEISDATLATGGENTRCYDLRKGPHLLEKAEFSGKFLGSRTDDANTNWLAQNRFERSDEFTGTLLKSYSSKHGKKPIILDENRRNTYKQFQLSVGLLEASVMSTFSRERKQLMPVGLHSDHGYARSLARFAANLGPLAWKITSKKIEKSLPPGIEFGRSWVVENDAKPSMPFLSTSSNPNENDGLDNQSQSRESAADSSSSSSRFGAHQSRDSLAGKGLESKPSFQVHKRPLQPVMNGYSNGVYSLNSQTSQMLTNSESVPPDLNVGFQSPGWSSSTRVHSAGQPDLALQL